MLLLSWWNIPFTWNIFLNFHCKVYVKLKIDIWSSRKKILWLDLLHYYQFLCKMSLKFVKEIWSCFIYIKLSIFWMFSILPMLLNMTFANIWALHSIFFYCESFLESNSPDILALSEANLDDSIDSGNFSVRSYLPLIRKNSSTHMHGPTVYVKEGIAFAWDLSLENSLCFHLDLLHSVS